MAMVFHGTFPRLTSVGLIGNGFPRAYTAQSGYPIEVEEVVHVRGLEETISIGVASATQKGERMTLH